MRKKQRRQAALKQITLKQIKDRFRVRDRFRVNGPEAECLK
jgi:hypothetical protein